MDLTPITRTTTAQTVADRLLSLIRQGTLKPGDQIPTERELTEKLVVGRSSVREALQILSTLNVIQVVPGTGAFVKEPQASEVLRADLIGFLIGNSMARELLEAREMIEPTSARLACIRGTTVDFELIESLLEKHEHALENGDKINEYAAEFHLLVARASHNRVVVSFMESILQLLMQRGRKISRIPNYAARELQEHREILQILKDRDDNRAFEVMLQHIIEAAVTYDTDEYATGEGGSM